MNALPAEEFTVEQKLRVGVLEVNERRFGLEIRYLAEICVIKEVLPLLSGRAEVLGAIELRGNIIPLVDPMMLCDAGSCSEVPQLAAIVEFDDRLLAIGVDRALAITDFEMGEVQPLYADGRSAVIPVNSGILAEETTINLLEPDSIFAQSDMPTRASKGQGTRKRELGVSRAFLTFQAGGATFGLDAVQIYGTVPRQPVEISTITGGDCLGVITYLGRRIPIMDATRVLGLGSALARDNPEIVVVNFHDEHLIGLAVDVIQQIRMVSSSELAEVGDMLGDGDALFSSVLTRNDGSQVFILNPETLLEQELLKRMSTLSDKPQASGTEKLAAAPKPEEEGLSNVDRVRQRCIVFSAGVRLCCKITDVVSILSMPNHLTPIQGAMGSVEGIFSFERRAVPLLTLATHLGRAPQIDADSNRVLLVGPPERRVGFIVDSVDGIETSEYIATADRAGFLSNRVARFKSSDIRGLLPFVDLDQTAGGISLSGF